MEFFIFWNGEEEISSSLSERPQVPVGCTFVFRISQVFFLAFLCHFRDFRHSEDLPDISADEFLT
jgi:hypothetical protein